MDFKKTNGNTQSEEIVVPQANQVMEIEARSGYNAQSGVWEWEAFHDGVRKVHKTYTASESYNDVNFIVGDDGDSHTATITGLKYSLTEPCGKNFISSQNA